MYLQHGDSHGIVDVIGGEDALGDGTGEDGHVSCR
jgi:hypothetical protein